MPIKAYMIYVKGPFENEDDIGEDLRSLNDTDPDHDCNVYLYAYTESKKQLKEFFKYRNKERFIVKKTKMNEKEFNSFKESHRSWMITDYDVETPSCMINTPTPDPSGVETFTIPLTIMEQDRITGLLEYYDDYIIGEIPESNVKITSVLVKCATKELKVALYNSGIIGILQYMMLLYSGDAPDMEGSFIMINELFVLLNYAGELFNFEGGIK